MLRITRLANGEVVFRLIGRMGAGDIGGLETLLSTETSGRRIVFDLKDLMLVDQGVVRFLGRCETVGIEIENCPAYIQKWIEQEKAEILRKNGERG
jgi:hypothetical protein